jgi:ABC-2 type transport system permease protein
MTGPIERLLAGRLAPLFRKELLQLGRNRRLVFMLVVPPTLQIMLFGFALNPEVQGLRLGVVDESRTAESREVVSAFGQSLAFRVAGSYASSDALGAAISAGDLDAGIVVPIDFAERRARGETADVQVLIDATNANTAAIAGGYAGRIVRALNERLQREEGALRPPGPALGRATLVPRIATLYNPGLESSWFIATGLIGTLLVLMGSLVSSGSMVREKETGTIEQLLMTPAAASEIIVAKTAPLLLLLTADIGIALAVCRLVFGVPVRGSLTLLFLSGVLCVFAGLGIGIFISTITRSQQQAQLMAFFVNPPVALLSGVTTPLEAMPEWLQPLTIVNPVRHFATISRGVLLKGIGLDVLYPNVIALVVAAVVLVAFSVWRFRKQLG